MRRALAIASGVEAVLIGLWIASFALGGAIGSSHQQWYVLTPLAFLLTPALSAAFAAVGRRATREVADIVSALLLDLLAINLCGFGLYVGLSGGGM